jgi:putative nucleotidyltransferase with HDIG domain
MLMLPELFKPRLASSDKAAEPLCQGQYRFLYCGAAMSNSVLLISDNIQRSVSVAEEFSRWFDVETIGLYDDYESQDQNPVFLIVDVDLSDRKIIDPLNSIINSNSKTKIRIFTVRKNKRSENFQANALGATDLLFRPVNTEAIRAIKSKYSEHFKEKPQDNGTENIESTVQDILSLQEDFYDCALSKEPLPKGKIESSSEQMVANLRQNTIDSWLEVVKTYHSYTHRHCMTVSGIVVSFALHLGMRRTDVEYLALSGLVHDIGKVRIPLSILDKPGKLTDEERAQINLHPGHSAEILRLDGQFDERVIDLALHHHEFLDGSGYPDGLSGEDISDPVRMLTIVDIFSALIDKRSYKDAMSGEKAYQILQDMVGKVDMDMLRAFEPVTLKIQAQGQSAPALQAAV